MDLPGWTDGDDTVRGIKRHNYGITIDQVLNTRVFPSSSDQEDGRQIAVADGDEGLAFFKAAPVGAWIWLMITCILLCLLDFFVMSRLPETFGWHLTAIFIWVGIAAGFNLLILTIEGPEQAFQWTSGYLLEWMLSMDNLFVFHLVFSAYQTPQDQIHKAAFVGILGAVVMRMVFFMVVSTLLSLFGWFRWPFGILLVYSGIEAARGEEEDEAADPRDTRLVRALTWCLGSRLQDTYDAGARLVVWNSEGRWRVTLLVVVIACLEFTDILFALDSVSAKVAQIPDQFLAFSSSVLAMFGLRAMFFIIKDLVEMFELLQYGLCVILVFIGLELMLGRYFHLQSSTICCMIGAVFLSCIAASKAKQAVSQRREERKSVDESPEPAAKGPLEELQPESEPAPLRPFKVKEVNGEIKRYYNQSDEQDVDEVPLGTPNPPVLAALLFGPSFIYLAFWVLGSLEII